MSGTFKFAAIVGLVALVSATAWAQAPRGPAGPQGPRGRGFFPGLNLTDAQRDQIRSLREEHQTATRDQAQQLGDAQRALHEAIFADNPDAGKIDALQHQVTSLSQQLQAGTLELQQRIAQGLTPEQRKLAREHRAQMRGFRAGRMYERRMMRQRRPGPQVF